MADTATFSFNANDFKVPVEEKTTVPKLDDLVVTPEDINGGEPAVEEPETIVEEIPKAEETTTPQIENPVELKNLLAHYGIEVMIKVDDNGEETEVDVNDVKLTTELVAQLIESKNSADLEDRFKDTISVKDLHQNTKAVIEFIAKGGDPTELLKIQENQNNLKQYDLDDEKDQEDLLRAYHKHKGTDEDEISIIIEGIKATGKLSEKADAAAIALDKFFKEQEKVQNDALESNIKAQKEALEKYGKELGGELKTNFKDFDDKVIKSLKDFAYKKIKTETEEYYEMDKVYHRLRSDPKEAALLSLFLKDRAKYDAHVTKQETDKLKIERSRNAVKVKVAGASNSKDIHNKTTFDKSKELTFSADDFGKR